MTEKGRKRRREEVLFFFISKEIESDTIPGADPKYLSEMQYTEGRKIICLLGYVEEE